MLLDSEPLRRQRLAVDLGQDQLLAEVGRADPNGDRLRRLDLPQRRGRAAGERQRQQQRRGGALEFR
jgi:hypothetical protein